MSKTRAEIQRAYRERNKQKEGSQYLQKERERVKKYYITSSELSRSDRKNRNAIKLISNSKMRERKRVVAKHIGFEVRFSRQRKGWKDKSQKYNYKVK